MAFLDQLSAAFGFDLHTIAVVLALTLPFVMLSIGCIIHAAGREFESEGRKMLWILVAGIPFIGFAVYLALGLRKSRRPGTADDPEGRSGK